MRLEGASPVGNLPRWGVHISFQVGVGVSVSSKCNSFMGISSPQHKLAQTAANCNSFLQMQAALLIQHTPGTHNNEWGTLPLWVTLGGQASGHTSQDAMVLAHTHIHAYLIFPC